MAAKVVHLVRIPAVRRHLVRHRQEVPIVVPHARQASQAHRAVQGCVVALLVAEA